MTYRISSRDYLERAKQCLEKDDIQSLFYAAFEIRCGVEARMQEYLEVQTHISKQKRKGWQIAKLERNIESVFRLGEKDAVLRVLNKDTNEIEFEARYTPVKVSLRNKVKKFGIYLHSAKKYYEPSDEYWTKFRKELETAVEGLERATTGKLLGPLLLHPNKKHVDMKLELITKEDHEMRNNINIGAESILQISYE